MLTSHLRMTLNKISAFAITMNLKTEAKVMYDLIFM